MAFAEECIEFLHVGTVHTGQYILDSTYWTVGIWGNENLAFLL